MQPLKKPIVLVGLMGCGKSAVGVRLAKHLHVSFNDIDKEIERQERMSVSLIFERYGEPYFREKEQQMLETLLQSKASVIATGGGVFMSETNRTLIKQYGISVWIRAEFEVLLERVSRKKTRPLLEKGDKATILRQLMDQRYPIYVQADITVDSTDAPQQEVVNAIEQALKTHHDSDS